MGSAILQGAIGAGIINAHDVIVADPDATKHTAAHSLGVRAVTSAETAASWLRERQSQAPQLLLAVKPQYLADAAAGLTCGPGLPTLVAISILAGMPSSKVRAAMGGGVRVVRAMPNLPAAIGQGATAACLGEGAAPGDDAFALRLFRAIGPLVVAIPEALMDAFTAVAGSGPAYLFYLAEAMIAAAVEQGFSEADAATTVRQTLLGAAALFQQSVQTPEQLRAAVTSKGGTTAAAMAVLDSCSAKRVWIDAMRAARARGAEIGRS
ncbi:MAG: pyrroline-5-carboxylate reductase [Planctomycetes bacterium]|nr:pyrroline-5-carboxylate reductase [Planctomycetota bacterium]